jgi:oligopeptide transport system substrate-binding protein
MKNQKVWPLLLIVLAGVLACDVTSLASTTLPTPTLNIAARVAGTETAIAEERAVVATLTAKAPTPTHVPPPPAALPSTSTPIPPTSTPLPTATEILPPSPTPLPGRIVVPLEKMEKSNPWLPIDHSAVPSTCDLNFNAKRPPFDNKLVRQAFAASIDRKAISTLAARLFSSATVRTGVTFTPPETLGRDLEGVVAVYDPVKARDLLAKAGYPNGQAFPEISIPIPFSANSPDNKLFDAATKMWLDNLKVSVKIQPGGYLTGSNAPYVRFWCWTAQFNDPDNFLSRIYHSPSAKNFGGFSNADFDRLIEQARATTDPATRQALYIQAERILLDDEAATIPIFYYYETSRDRLVLGKEYGIKVSAYKVKSIYHDGQNYLAAPGETIIWVRALFFKRGTQWADFDPEEEASKLSLIDSKEGMFERPYPVGLTDMDTSGFYDEEIEGWTPGRSGGVIGVSVYFSVPATSTGFRLRYRDVPLVDLGSIPYDR